MDNVFIKRLWRSLKYEDIYLKGYSDGHEAKAGIARWIEFTISSAPSGAGKPRADGGLAGRCHRRIRRGGCGYDASRKREAWTTLRVAQIPTATTAASKSSVKYWEERTAAAPLKKPDPVALSIGSTSVQENDQVAQSNPRVKSWAA
ncbi:hypothetical protein LRP30_07065 [Bradyrhizobium sp. C-145]|uniref:hypothetical protein n=1 Tax=Bradyrhizobium sp. C-145 TaxID=574727 RepID=UPI00201B85AD|nr:hypothetical protein [Bradyrhizobium sp. C-145]UQR65017.1 hypothetical protein LRP30_07065 [Bradyrhizobium sp. C-145]